jgi:hypothetical protein
MASGGHTRGSTNLVSRRGVVLVSVSGAAAALDIPANPERPTAPVVAARRPKSLLVSPGRLWPVVPGRTFRPSLEFKLRSLISTLHSRPRAPQGPPPESALSAPAQPGGFERRNEPRCARSRTPSHVATIVERHWAQRVVNSVVAPDVAPSGVIQPRTVAFRPVADEFERACT